MSHIYLLFFVFLLPMKNNEPNPAISDPNNAYCVLSSSPVFGNSFLFSYFLACSFGCSVVAFSLLASCFVDSVSAFSLFASCFAGSTLSLLATDSTDFCSSLFVLT
ncbi:hypothetical protein [Mammaliicoccus sciuri]|uniref:hypothetical protein n=1 Tax=Mammaliicoccus sciuri TaxID=1296 RepID=UPI002883F437|nr:hypothetical protein [Mammaliicoccus sciuri]MDT0694485.1 hypothetical protein [Mammaliicoccus sciuri]